ncbi:MAG TPA: putative 2OG-Fe(II) oxygenase [Rhizomicrobium sp.]|nr:putative 2OG-Fe(II) oxygenase [Rhizomicrobium sp.]
MVAPKPQVRSMFATPVCVHYLPVAQEFNAELRPLILEKAKLEALNGNHSQGWRSAPDLETWGGQHMQTLFRVARELADSLTATRNGSRVTLDWKIAAAAAIRQKGDFLERAARPGWYWSGVYYVDDGYQKLDDESLGGECELGDPRGVLPAMVAPQYGFRVPNGLTAGQNETIRPQSGMIILHPSWQPRGERRFDGGAQRVTIELDLAVP